MSESAQRRADGTFLPGTHWRKHKPYWDREWLDTEYTTKKRSASDIARQFGVGDTAILYWLDKLGVKTRSIAETRTMKYWGLSGPDNPMYGKRGHLNPNWIDGSSPERQKLYARSEWRTLSAAIFWRDRYHCQRCQSPHRTDNKLHAHHIKPWAGNPTERFNADNLVTLCGECHRWVHSKKNAQREYLA